MCLYFFESAFFFWGKNKTPTRKKGCLHKHLSSQNWISHFQALFTVNVFFYLSELPWINRITHMHSILSEKKAPIKWTILSCLTADNTSISVIIRVLDDSSLSISSICYRNTIISYPYFEYISNMKLIQWYSDNEHGKRCPHNFY